jgi:hypothetical protein
VHSEQPKLPMGVLNPIPFCPIWGKDELRAGEKERPYSYSLKKHKIIYHLRLASLATCHSLLGWFLVASVACN